MPKDFEECIRKHGRVRTKTLPDGKYIPICFDEKGSHAGEVHKKKGKDKK